MRTVKLTSSKTPVAVSPVDLENNLADLGLLLREELLDVAADHPAHDLGLGHVLDGIGRDVFAVAHDRDHVAEREDLVEAVRDEDDAAPLVAEAPCDGEQSLDLDAAERRRRLIHDQEAGIEQDGFRDLDDLLVGDRQALRGAVGVDVHAEAFEHLVGLRAHALAVDPADAVGRGWRPMNMFSTTDRSGNSVGSW